MPSFFKSSIPIRKNILVLIKFSPTSSACAYSSVSSPAMRRARNEFEPIKTRIEALKKYGLSNLNIIWPETASIPKRVDYRNKNPKSIREMYGEADLSRLPIFKGGFINFGYWPNTLLGSKQVTDEERIACSKEMYKVIGNLGGILRESNILEVGCGLGYGSSFLSQHYQPKLVVGMDISPDQIARAKIHQVSGINSGKLRFAIGEAESMPFTDGSFDYVVSVEAAQHFVSMNSFSEEVSRVLKPGGKLVFTSFFPTLKEGVDALNAIVPGYHIHGSQNTVDDVVEKLSKHMENVKVSSIGENVWRGFSKWLDQIGYHNQWSKIWEALYKKGLIDYMVFEGNSEAPKVKSDFRHKEEPKEENVYKRNP